MKHSPPHRRATGFTLLEILVAVTILGIALVSLLGLHARNIRLTAETQELTMTNLLASRLVAITKAGRIPEDGVIEGAFTDDDGQSLRLDKIYGGEESEGYTWTRDTRASPLARLPFTKFITVSVSPPGATSRTELHFVMANRERVRAILRRRQSPDEDNDE